MLCIIYMIDALFVSVEDGDSDDSEFESLLGVCQVCVARLA